MRLPPTLRAPRSALRLVAACAALALAAGCAPERPAGTAAASRLAPRAAWVDATREFAATPVGAPFEGRPWVSHVAIVDLDRDGRNDLVACDDKLLAVVWLRQTAPGAFEETPLATGLPAPVHTEAVDMDADGDLDLLVACMGEVFPNNDHIGSVVILENDGRQSFTKRVVAERIMRVTDVRAGDFDGDGRPDLAVAQFGYDQGEIRWMRNLGGWRFESRNLLNLSGTINVCVADMDGNRTPDIVAVVSQQWEEIHLFQNDGRGGFTSKILFGSTNEDYGSSGISLCDLNRDGRPDILYTNGDGFGYADPGQRPWHGLQWLENAGDGFFRYHRIADMPGAYSPVGTDLDGDGATDIVCVSGFNDWKKPGAVSLVVFRNDGRQGFTPRVLAREPIQLISCAVGDLDGSGRPAIAAAGFYAYPPFDRMGRLTVWRRAAP